MGLVGVILCAVYTAFGVSGFVSFMVLQNYPGAFWALVTGVLYAVTTHLRWLNHKRELEHWYSSKELGPLALMGFVAFVFGTSGLVYHLAIQILRDTPIVPVSEDEVIPIVWAFMTLKGGIVLWYTARRYSLDEEERRSLLRSDKSSTA